MTLIRILVIEADYSSKPKDFTYDTIKKLIEQGQEDAILSIEMSEGAVID